MKHLKTWGIVFIIMSIMVLFIAVNVDIDDLRGGPYDTDLGRLCGDIFPYFMYLSIPAVFALGIYFVTVSGKPEQRYRIRVLAVNKGNITIEFENGTRKVVSNMLNKPIVTGDVGIITLKGNVIADFKSNTYHLNHR